MNPPPPPRTAKPSLWFVLLRRLELWAGLLLVALAGVWFAVPWLAVGGVAGAMLVLVWSLLVWFGENYRVTETTIAAESGVFRLLRVEAALGRVQHTVVYKSIRERLFGLGTIGVATAGSDLVEIVWRMMARPDEVAAGLRAVTSGGAGVGGEGTDGLGVTEPARPRTPPPPVIGIAGGIGAGKSTVAKILERLGCLVIDSDARAKAALDRPEVRARLVEWWGQEVLAADGRVDRGKVASIIFAEPEQRARLEGLVHPMVRGDRAAMIAEAGEGVAAVVIDAPLLFEVGLDKECDAVIFVEASFEERLARVAATRGWDEAELRRREAAQMPVEEKRARASHVVTNSGGPEEQKELESAVRAALQSISARSEGPRAG